MAMSPLCAIIIVYRGAIYTAGQVATVTTVSATSYTATYTVADGDTDGTTPLSMSFKDLADNDGLAYNSESDEFEVGMVTATTDSSESPLWEPPQPHLPQCPL